MKIDATQQKRSTILFATVSIFLSFAALHTSDAATYYVTVNGAGNQNGNSWANAKPFSQINWMLNTKMQAGDTLNLGSGDYYRRTNIDITSAGTEASPKRIIGVDHNGGGLPLIRSDWSYSNPTTVNDLNRAAIEVSNWARHWVVENIRIRGYEKAVLANGENAKTGWTFRNVDADTCRYGFWLNNLRFSTIANCDVERYTKHGFRLERGCEDIVIQNCTANMSDGDTVWYDRAENFPFGFFLNGVSGDSNRRIEMINCTASNHRKNGQAVGAYWNGDGFVVEGYNADVEIVTCRSFNNEDGGFDVKINMEIRDSVAFQNKRNFRFHNGGTLQNSCSGYWFDRATGTGGSGIWSNKGTVAVNRCTVHGTNGFGVHEDGSGRIDLSKCLISFEVTNWSFTIGNVTKSEVTQFHPTNGGVNPNYVNPHQSWDGLGTDMNTQTYQASRGYYE